MIEQCCLKFGLDPEEFPKLMEGKTINGVLFFLNQYLKKKPSDPEFKGLDRIEDLMKGCPEMLSFAVQFLMQAGKSHEAKGIYLRNKLT